MQINLTPFLGLRKESPTLVLYAIEPATLTHPPRQTEVMLPWRCLKSSVKWAGGIILCLWFPTWVAGTFEDAVLSFKVWAIMSFDRRHWLICLGGFIFASTISNIYLCDVQSVFYHQDLGIVYCFKTGRLEAFSAWMLFLVAICCSSNKLMYLSEKR